MRILYICDQSPFEHRYGAQQRSQLILRALSAKGEIDLVCFTKEELSIDLSEYNCSIKFFGPLKWDSGSMNSIRLNKIRNLFFSYNPNSIYPENSQARSIVSRLLESNNYDLIVIRYLKNAFACGLLHGANIVVDVDDLPEETILSYVSSSDLSFWKKLLYKAYALRARYHTGKFIKNIKHSFFPNIAQCTWKNSSYLPNIPFPGGRLNQDTRGIGSNFGHVVLFVGFMKHDPNLDGVTHFIEKIWPLVKQAVPDAVFRIAGDGIPIESLGKLQETVGVKVLGFVPDIYEEYLQCQAVVVPVYYGAGTNIKVLEAMHNKRACVVSAYAAGAYGSDLKDNENILIAYDDMDFSKKLIRLLTDEQFNRIIAQNGETTIREKYSFDVFKGCVEQALF